MRVSLEHVWTCIKPDVSWQWQLNITLQTKPMATLVLMQCQASPTWGQHCGLCPACGPDGQSVTTTNTGLRFSQLMSSQSNLSVCELQYSSCFHVQQKTHCSHWFTVHCRRDTIYDGPPGWTLFVCLHLWLRFGSLLSPLSCRIHSAKVKIQFYVLLYLELSCKNKYQILIHGLQGESSAWHFKSTLHLFH